MKRLYQDIANRFGTTPEEVRREIQASIDEAWATDDPEIKARQNELFPNGKPTAEQVILTLAIRKGPAN